MLATKVETHFCPINNTSDEKKAIQAPAELDLPTRILRATSRITLCRTNGFEMLSARCRDVLAEVVRCISISKPTLPIPIRRETLAARLDCSVPTINRALALLESQGWIVREEQVKSRRIGFQVGAIALTSGAASSLGFNLPSPAQVDREEKQKNLRESPVIDAIWIPEQSSRQPQQADGLAQKRSEEQPNSQAKPVIDESRIPQGLQWLLKMGITPFGVFKLMKEARNAGALLEDVAQACLEHIQKAKKPFAYISTLISQKKDWKWLAAQSKQVQEVEKASHVEAQAASEWKSQVEKVQGKILIDREKSIAWKIVEALAVGFRLDPRTEKLGEGIGSRPFTPGFMRAVDEGRLAWKN